MRIHMVKARGGSGLGGRNSGGTDETKSYGH